MKTLLSFIFVLNLLPLFSQIRDCPENGTYPLPVLGDKTRVLFNQQLLDAKKIMDASPMDYNAIIWYGRRLAYTGQYYDAIKIFDKAIALEPENAIAFRHRGHRWLTLRCFDNAIADFEIAASLIQGKLDLVEQDGLPNAQNIPTSTLHSNIWYHLGLAYFIKRDYQKALKAYQNCLVVSRNADMYVATLNWFFITLLKLGKKEEAKNLLTALDPNLVLLENQDYHHILMLYKNEEKINQINNYLTERKDLSLPSFGFGLGNYLLEMGRCEDAKMVFNKILASNQWSSFGFIAAEKELLQLKCGDKTKN